MKVTPESLAASGTEHGHQCALFCHAVEAARFNWRWSLLFAIPNGGLRGKATGSTLKASGVKQGVPDVCLPVATKSKHHSIFFLYAGLYIEMKRPGNETKKPGKLEEAQKYWRDVLRGQGYIVETAWGWEAARDIIQVYLNECPP